MSHWLSLASLACLADVSLSVQSQTDEFATDKFAALKDWVLSQRGLKKYPKMVCVLTYLLYWETWVVYCRHLNDSRHSSIAVLSYQILFLKGESVANIHRRLVNVYWKTALRDTVSK